MATHYTFADLSEVRFAREVQNRIFPSSRPSIPGLDYYGDWRPAGGISGDYLDYFEMDQGNLGLAIGEVAGQGPHAALLTASLHSIVRALRFSQGGSMAEYVAAIDELFCEVCPDGCYASLFVAQFDPVAGKLHYVNAGHEPPFVLRKNGRVVRLEACGTVIGMLRKSTYRERVVTLGEGDLLVAYSDGLCEAKNLIGEEWGWRRLLETIRGSAVQRSRDMVEHVFEEQDAFTGGNPQDDRTLWMGRIDEAHHKLVLRVAESCEEPAAAA